MDYHEYIEQKRELQSKLLKFLDEEVNTEENYQNFIDAIKKQNIENNHNEMKIFLSMISVIINHHYREQYFVDKIAQIFHYLKDIIKNNFTNSEIYDIFYNNKMALFIMIQEQIFFIDESIANDMLNFHSFDSNFSYFFAPEIAAVTNNKSRDVGWFYYTSYDLINKNKMKEEEEELKENPDIFFEIRKTGENNDQICKLIRNDLIEEFIIYINKNTYSLKSQINSSIYETNYFLIVNNPSLIEYSAFFGSVQIFKYLYLNGAELKPSLWKYAVHGNNSEIIHILEENEIVPINNNYDKHFFDAIKCHNIDMANFIENNYLNEAFTTNRDDCCMCCFKYFNFLFFPSNFDDNQNIFLYACNNGYLSLVEYLFKYKEIELKSATILNCSL